MQYRVLVVDDESGIRGLLSLAFKRAGFYVQVASDVAEAKAQLLSKRFDFVLTDVRMQGLSGHDLVRWLANSYPATRVGIMSGCDLECESCPFAGRCSILPKPFKPAEAVAFVERLMRRR